MANKVFKRSLTLGSIIILVVPLTFGAATARGGQIIVQASGVRSASIQAETFGSKPVTGTVSSDRIVFANLTPGVRYSTQLMYTDGQIQQGVDMRWYDTEKLREDAGDLTPDDRLQINAILTQVLSFFNRNDLILLIGNHDRATALVQLIRDKNFHSDKHGEVIWRMELWYLKNRHGGWQKIQQTDRTLQRVRFPSEAAFHQATDHLKWLPSLGGLMIPKGQTSITIKATAQS